MWSGTLGSQTGPGFNSGCRSDSGEELQKDPGPQSCPRNSGVIGVRASLGLQAVLKAPQGA